MLLRVAELPPVRLADFEACLARLANVELVTEVFAIGLSTCLGFAAAWALWWWAEQRW